MWWNFIGRGHDEIVEFRRQWQADVIGRDNPDGRFGIVAGYDGAAAAGARTADRATEAAALTASGAAHGSTRIGACDRYCSAEVSRARLSSTVERSGCCSHSSSVSSRLSAR